MGFVCQRTYTTQRRRHSEKTLLLYGLQLLQLRVGGATLSQWPILSVSRRTAGRENLPQNSQQKVRIARTNQVRMRSKRRLYG
jgi:hypothetical protein